MYTNITPEITINLFIEQKISEQGKLMINYMGITFRIQ